VRERDAQCGTMWDVWCVKGRCGLCEQLRGVCVCEREKAGKREKGKKARHRCARPKHTDLGYVVGFGGGGILYIYV